MFEKQRVLGAEGTSDFILKPENVSPGCKDIFNALGDEFLFSTIMGACFDFLGPKT